MTTPVSSEKIFMRDEGRRARGTGLPRDLVERAARRLRTLALLYAFTFFMAGLFPQFIDAADRARMSTSAIYWAPGVISILIALVVAAVVHSPRLPLSWVTYIGLAFQVVGSFGIAAAEFLGISLLDPAQHVGLSWVAPWAMLFTVVVPSKPWLATLATLASVSAVPLTVGYVVSQHPLPGLTPQVFFLGLVFPYLLVVIMAYVGARTIHSLRREVTRARELGGYRLVERLGGGGMGEVWRAEHHLLARPAAIKLVRSEVDGTPGGGKQREMRERFGREAQATAMMRSPHTIELYDFGVANDGTFYYVMELLDGFDLETLVRRFGPVPAERAIRMLRQVCHSLGEAHAKGLIHRDIKPANVFTCRYGREVDFVKVLDFGMVKHRRDGNTDETQLTGTHAIAGTPAYMAPEQVLGARAVDARADIYAVGCVGYWLLTGQLVFDGRTAMEVMTKHAHDTPPAPSSRCELVVPPELDAIILSCLAKNPDDRPASADLLAEILEKTPVRTPWTKDRARDWWERNHPVRAEEMAVEADRTMA